MIEQLLAQGNESALVRRGPVFKDKTKIRVTKIAAQKIRMTRLLLGEYPTPEHVDGAIILRRGKGKFKTGTTARIENREVQYAEKRILQEIAYELVGILDDENGEEWWRKNYAQEENGAIYDGEPGDLMDSEEADVKEEPELDAFLSAAVVEQGPAKKEIEGEKDQTKEEPVAEAIVAAVEEEINAALQEALLNVEDGGYQGHFLSVIQDGDSNAQEEAAARLLELLTNDFWRFTASAGALMFSQKWRQDNKSCWKRLAETELGREIRYQFHARFEGKELEYSVILHRMLKHFKILDYKSGAGISEAMVQAVRERLGEKLKKHLTMDDASLRDLFILYLTKRRFDFIQHLKGKHRMLEAMALNVWFEMKKIQDADIGENGQEGDFEALGALVILPGVIGLVFAGLSSIEEDLPARPRQIRVKENLGRVEVNESLAYVVSSKFDAELEAYLSVCVACAAFNTKTGERILAYFLPNGHWKFVDKRRLRYDLSAAFLADARRYFQALLSRVKWDSWHAAVISSEAP